jgi:HEAT repeat protein
MAYREHPSIAAILMPGLVLLLCSVLFGAGIRSGDKVVTIEEAPVRAGENTLATARIGEIMVATAVQDDWVGVTLERRGKSVQGWLDQRHLVCVPPDPEQMVGVRAPSQIEEEPAWRELAKSETRDAAGCLRFIGTYPNGRFVRQASWLLIALYDPFSFLPGLDRYRYPSAPDFAASAPRAVALPSLIQECRTALDHPHPEIRYRAVCLLHQMGGGRWLLDSGENKVAAIKDRLVSGLIARLRQGHKGAIFELAALEDPRAADPLADVLKSQQPFVREVRAAESTFAHVVRSDDEVCAEVRALAAEALGYMPRPRVRLSDSEAPTDNRETSILIAALNDKHGVVRAAAARALGMRAEKRAVMPLVAALEREDIAKALAEPFRGAAESVLRALGTIGDKRAVGPLVEFLIRCSSDNKIRTERNYDGLVEVLQETLCLLKGPELTDALCRAAEHDDGSVRYSALRVMRLAPDPRMTESLVGTLKKKKRYVKNYGALAAVAPMSLDTLEVSIGLDVLAGTGPREGNRVTNAILDILRDDDYRGIWHPAESALAATAGRDAVESLEAALLDSREQVRRVSARSLASVANYSDVRRLVPLLKDQANSVREAAAGALGTIGSAQGVDALVQALRDKDESVRNTVVRALARIESGDTVDPLIAALRDESWLVRGAAIEALEHVGDKRAIEPLLETLAREKRDAGTDVRVSRRLGSGPDYRGRYWSIAHAIARVSNTGSKRPLGALLRDDNRDVREAAARTIEAFHCPGYTSELVTLLEDSDASVRGAAAAALAGAENRTCVVPLMHALEDTHKSVREVAARSLGCIGDGRAADALIAVLQRKDTPQPTRSGGLQGIELHEDRCAAAKALGKLRDTRAVDTLTAELANQWGGTAAARALARIGGDQARLALQAALTDKNPQKRRLAAEAIGCLGDKVAIPHLVLALSDTREGASAVAALLALGWSPKTDGDVVRILIAERRKEMLLAIWPDTKKVLRVDARSQDVACARNAACALISLGQREVLPDLIEVLGQHRSVELAEIYLNCGRQELEEAAREWCTIHGYSIQKRLDFEGSARWGSM